MSIEKRLKELGLSLPDAPKPVANYIPAVRAGRLLFTSGLLPLMGARMAFEGKLGRDLSVEQGREAAAIAILNALAVIHQETGDLDAIDRIIRLTGYVASAPGFTQQPAVLNGASDLLVSLFGESGRHTRVALGAAELPLNSPVELDLIVQLKTASKEAGGD